MKTNRKRAAETVKDVATNNSVQCLECGHTWTAKTHNESCPQCGNGE